MTDAITQRKPPASKFILRYGNDVQFVNNKQHFAVERGNLPEGFSFPSRYSSRLVGKPAPAGMVYPWTEDGKACSIAGQEVQLVKTDSATKTLESASSICTNVLDLLCKERLREGARHVYQVLLRAINAVGPQTMFN